MKLFSCAILLVYSLLFPFCKLFCKYIWKLDVSCCTIALSNKPNNNTMNTHTISPASRVRPYPHFLFPDEVTISVSKMSPDSCKWHSVAAGSYELRCVNYGWFPAELLMGTVKRYYSDTLNIGATISGNMGTASIAVVDVDTAVSILKSKGYNIVFS